MPERRRIEVVHVGAAPPLGRPLSRELCSALGWPDGGAGPERLGPQFDAAAQDRLQALAASAPVIVCLVAPTEALVRQLIDAGAAGVVPDGDPTALRAAARAVRAGLLVTPRNSSARRPPVLTPRERQILGLVTMQMSNGEIAARLFVSESTIKTHLANAFAKLGVRSRHAATAAILDPANRLGLGILSLTAPPVDRP